MSLANDDLPDYLDPDEHECRIPPSESRPNIVAIWATIAALAVAMMGAMYLLSLRTPPT